MENLIKKVAIETTKRHLNGLYLPIRSIYKMVKIDLRIQFKISVMKRKFENQKHKAQVSNVENKSYVCTKGFGLGQGGEVNKNG